MGFGCYIISENALIIIDDVSLVLDVFHGVCYRVRPHPTQTRIRRITYAVASA